MLTVLTARAVRPEIEPIDRDPGIVALLSGLVRTARRGLSGARTRFRIYRQVADEAGLFASATARPYTHR